LGFSGFIGLKPYTRYAIPYDDPRYDGVADRHACDLRRGKWLYPLYHGGRYWQRMLEAFLDDPADYLVKLDTDARVFRPLSVEPVGDAFGCIWGSSGWRYLQGGFHGVSRSVVERLHDRDYFLDPALRDPAHWSPVEAVAYFRKTNRVSTDLQMALALMELDVPLSDHPEVWSVGHERCVERMHAELVRRIENADGRFAVTHPHKVGARPRNRRHLHRSPTRRLITEWRSRVRHVRRHWFG